MNKKTQTPMARPNDLLLRSELIKSLKMHFHFKYELCPEKETPEDYNKRCLKGQGFIDAIDILSNLIVYSNRMSIQKPNECVKCHEKDFDYGLYKDPYAYIEGEPEVLFYCCKECAVKLNLAELNFK
jgi:DNA-directed RNA polymerase subunit M/transcription elongation factor TFIIS